MHAVHISDPSLLDEPFKKWIRSVLSNETRGTREYEDIRVGAYHYTDMINYLVVSIIHFSGFTVSTFFL